MEENASVEAWVAVLRRMIARDRRLASRTCRASRKAALVIEQLDVSGGLETLPVLVDAPAEEAERLRAGVRYTVRSFPSHGREIPLQEGAGCAGVCGSACGLSTCPCGKRSGADHPPTECGPACSCRPETCANRETQLRVAVPLTLVPAGPCGWAVTTDGRLPAGAFVAVYAGEYLSTDETHRRQREEYDKERHYYLLSVREHSQIGEGDPVCFRTNIDPTRSGNIARWFNHACSEETLEARIVRQAGFPLPSVAFFTTRAVEAGEELRFCYGASDGPSGSGSAEADDEPEEGAPPESAAAAAAAVPGDLPRGLGRAPRRRCLCGTSACTGFLPFASD